MRATFPATTGRRPEGAFPWIQTTAPRAAECGPPGSTTATSPSTTDNRKNGAPHTALKKEIPHASLKPASVFLRRRDVHRRDRRAEPARRGIGEPRPTRGGHGS